MSLDSEQDKSSAAQPGSQGLVQLFLVFLKLGLTSFGGPVAHLGYFRKEFVETRRWFSEGQYAQLVAICQFLPGPASSQVGFAIGMARGGFWGGVTAFTAFTSPSVIALIIFALMLPSMDSALVSPIIQGLKLVACVVVLDAVWGMWRKLCPDLTRKLLAAAVCIFLIFLSSSSLQILCIALGLLVGLKLCEARVSDQSALPSLSYGKRGAMISAVIFLILLLVLPLVAGANGGILDLAHVFYQTGAMVFGGGHVVLPLLQEAVVDTGSLSHGEFLAGYGASQAIPGPMFSFAAYLGALMPEGNSSLIGAIVATLMIFLPGFLLVISVLPFWKNISENMRVQAGIMGVNAAVVGILAAALYDPILTSGITSLGDVFIALVGFALLFKFKLSPLFVVLWCVSSSMLMSLI